MRSTRAVLGLGLALLLSFSAIGEASRVSTPKGAWYLALDAEPYGLPPGTTLPGLAVFHRDKSFRIVDGGDFGGAPFGTADTPQVGSWRRRNGRIEATGLFLQADAATGEVLSWLRVEFLLEEDGSKRLAGTVNVFALPCGDPAPFPVFGCPDPIAAAGDFVPVPPTDVPVRLRRVPVR